MHSKQAIPSGLRAWSPRLTWYTFKAPHSVWVLLLLPNLPPPLLIAQSLSMSSHPVIQLNRLSVEATAEQQRPSILWAPPSLHFFRSNLRTKTQLDFFSVLPQSPSQGECNRRSARVAARQAISAKPNQSFQASEEREKKTETRKYAFFPLQIGVWFDTQRATAAERN